MDFLPLLCFTVFIVGLIAVAYVFITRSLEIVPEGTVAVVERGGEFRGVLKPGRHFLTPFDRIRAIVELQEFSVTIPADTVITQNAIVIGLDMDLSYRIARYVPQKVPRDQQGQVAPVAIIQMNKLVVREKDVRSAVYGIDNWQEKTKREATAIMYDFFSMVDLERDIFGNDGGALKRIAGVIRDMANEEALKYGVEVTKVTLYNITLDEPTRMFLTSQRRARLQNKILLQQAESQRQIQQTLGLTNEQLLRWFEIEARKEKPPASEANFFIGEDRGATSLLPTTGPFTPRSAGNGGSTGPGGGGQGGGNK